MRTTNYAQNAIKGFEGFRHKSYKDGGGVWTCGYGHTKGVTEKTRFSKETAERKFLEDLAEVEKSLAIAETELGELSQGEWDALVSFVFNLGFGAFKGSTLYKRIKWRHNDEMIGHEFLRWVYCKGRPMPGLIKRRQWEGQRWYE